MASCTHRSCRHYNLIHKQQTNQVREYVIVNRISATHTLCHLFASDFDGSYLVGTAHITQKRVRAERCVNYMIPQAKQYSCHPDFYSIIEQKQPFGRLGQYRWTDSPQSQTNSALMRPQGQYGRGGYTEVFTTGNLTQEV